MGAESLIRPVEWHREPERIELDWRVREGLHGLIGRLRPPGTALIIEDVCVPPARIAEAAADLQALLGEHGFLTGVAGHASAGNLHFMLTPDFAKAEDLERYESFMGGLVELVLDKYDGSLKAEHGTGVNMAPYVAREWGEPATELMWRVKRLADPDGVLAPGVVLNDDPGVHLRNLSTTPEIEEVANHCVECGFCEPVCPSRDLTTTPRQRIVLRRELARQPAGSPVAVALEREYEYDGLETCAADGTCGLACPLAIDTGKLVKEFRAREAVETGGGSGAGRRPRRWGVVERGRARPACAPGPIAERVGGGALPRPAQPLPRTTARAPRPSTSLRAPTGSWAARSAPAARRRPCRRAGRGLGAGRDAGLDPAGRRGSAAAASRSARRATRGAHARDGHRHGRGASGAGAGRASCRSSCDASLVHPRPRRRGRRRRCRKRLRERHAELEILDSIEWLERLLPNLPERRTFRAPCGSPDLRRPPSGPGAPARGSRRRARRRGGGAARRDLLRLRGRPRDAPSRAHRRRRPAPRPRELAERGPFDAYVSTNRTCEIGLERGTGQPYRSLAAALEDADALGGLTRRQRGAPSARMPSSTTVRKRHHESRPMNGAGWLVVGQAAHDHRARPRPRGPSRMAPASAPGMSTSRVSSSRPDPFGGLGHHGS